MPAYQQPPVPITQNQGGGEVETHCCHNLEIGIGFKIYGVLWLIGLVIVTALIFVVPYGNTCHGDYSSCLFGTSVITYIYGRGLTIVLTIAYFCFYVFVASLWLRWCKNDTVSTRKGLVLYFKI